MVLLVRTQKCLRVVVTTVYHHDEDGALVGTNCVLLYNSLCEKWKNQNSIAMKWNAQGSAVQCSAVQCSAECGCSYCVVCWVIGWHWHEAVSQDKVCWLILQSWLLIGWWSSWSVHPSMNKVETLVSLTSGLGSGGIAGKRVALLAQHLVQKSPEGWCGFALMVLAELFEWDGSAAILSWVPALAAHGCDLE